MRSIQFKINPEATAEKQKANLDSVLTRLRGLPGIHDVQPLDSASNNMEIMRLAYAYIEDDADIHQLRDLIESQPEIEKAEVPPPRHLIL